MNLKKQTLIVIAGAIWLLVGAGLLAKGVSLILFATHLSLGKAPLMSALMSVLPGGVMPSAFFLVALGLALGIVKGRLALSRSASRTIKRLAPMKEPIKLSRLYRLQDFLLIAGMVALGRLMHYFSCPSDIHGLIDVAVGSGLACGAMIYFRFALKMNKDETKPSES